MSDESFRRPSTDAGAPSSRSAAQDAAQPEEVAVVHEFAAPKPSRRKRVRGEGARILTVPGTVGIAVTALVAGLAGGAILLDAPAPPPIAITVDTFPREVLLKERDDIPWRDEGSKMAIERLDAQFEDQLAGYRQAYGGDGATLAYKGFSLTIVNGRLAATVPSQPDPSSEDAAWVVSLRSGDTLCVSQDPPVEPPPIELSDVLVDQSKDVFYWLERGRTDATTECVLVDEDRNISLRLVGQGWRKRTVQSAEALRDELVALHASLVE